MLRGKSLSRIILASRKGCVNKKESPVSYFDLSTLFDKYSVLVPRSASKVSRWGVGAQVQRARVYARTRNLFRRTRTGNTRALVRRYHLWLWIAAVYKFGGTLTDYKYRGSEYIINSFITAVINICAQGLHIHTLARIINSKRPGVFYLTEFPDRPSTLGISILIKLVLLMGNFWRKCAQTSPRRWIGLPSRTDDWLFIIARVDVRVALASNYYLSAAKTKHWTIISAEWRAGADIWFSIIGSSDRSNIAKRNFSQLKPNRCRGCLVITANQTNQSWRGVFIFEYF